MAAASASTSTLLPQLARETLSAWHWVKVKLAAGLAAGTVALIFVAATAGGVLTRHAVSQAVPVNYSLRAMAPTTAADQLAAALSTSAVNDSAQAFRKTGAITGLVLDERAHPIAGANVWGGFGQQPYAQDTTDQSGQFALDQVAVPSFVTVTADGYAVDQQSFDPTNLPGPLVFRLSPVSPLGVRVVDESGQGVAGVRLFLQQ
jgi:hypothetical protein